MPLMLASQQAVNEKVDLPVIWDTPTLMGRYRNGPGVIVDYFSRNVITRLIGKWFRDIVPLISFNSVWNWIL